MTRFYKIGDDGVYAEQHVDLTTSPRWKPVVVIDPEDREQVERLVRACPADWSFDQDEETEREVVDHMQAALRSLITPPRPPEPLNLGAVVEDAHGDRWVRWVENHSSPWRGVTFNAPGLNREESRFYWEIDGPKVLFAGWSE